MRNAVGFKALLTSAPIRIELLSKALGLLESAVDVLGLSNDPDREQMRRCALQVSAALASSRLD
jgi:hypothetical protein